VGQLQQPLHQAGTVRERAPAAPDIATQNDGSGVLAAGFAAVAEGGITHAFFAFLLSVSVRARPADGAVAEKAQSPRTWWLSSWHGALTPGCPSTSA
jgi:hypothetical protein